MELIKYSMASYGAQFCEVRVHEETGEVRLSRWLGAFDCGRVANPKTATSQLRGGIVMGIGMALRKRRSSTSAGAHHESFAGGIPRPREPRCSRLRIFCFSIFPTNTRHSAHEASEKSASPAPRRPIANAIFHATGKRIRDLPITLDKLM